VLCRVVSTIEILTRYKTTGLNLMDVLNKTASREEEEYI
jgi:hypothetical protein